ncbi:MAG: carbon-nitrogen hydrolase family protein [Thermoprotei archaeon]
MIRIAVAQMVARPFDREANLRLMGALMRKASDMGSRLVVFPELCVTGYSALHDAVRVAESVPGPSTLWISKLAAELGLSVVIGLIESHSGGLYDSAVIVNSSGDLVGVYRKVNLWSAEKKVFRRGTDPLVFDVEGFRVGVGICYDLEFPEYSRSLALMGAELLVYPSAQPAEYRDRVRVYVKSRALENGVYVAFSNLAGVEGEYSFAASSVVIGPDGSRLTPRIRGGCGLAVCEVNREVLRRERCVNPYLEDLVLTGKTYEQGGKG